MDSSLLGTTKPRHIGVAIYLIRAERNLTQKQLADLTRARNPGLNYAMGQNVISRFEMGHVSPSPRVQEALAKALGVPVEAFDRVIKGEDVKAVLNPPPPSPAPAPTANLQTRTTVSLIEGDEEELKAPAPPKATEVPGAEEPTALAEVDTPSEPERAETQVAAPTAADEEPTEALAEAEPVATEPEVTEAPEAQAKEEIAASLVAEPLVPEETPEVPANFAAAETEQEAVDEVETAAQAMEAVMYPPTGILAQLEALKAERTALVKQLEALDQRQEVLYAQAGKEVDDLAVDLFKEMRVYINSLDPWVAIKVIEDLRFMITR